MMISVMLFFCSSRRRYTIFDCDLVHDVCFFFSSRRRHTRFDCDWSSDVCSSDLYGLTLLKSCPHPKRSRSSKSSRRRSPATLKLSSTGRGSESSSIIVTNRRLASVRSEEHTSELQSQSNVVCRLLLEKKNWLPQPRFCSSLFHHTTSTPIYTLSLHDALPIFMV